MQQVAHCTLKTIDYLIGHLGHALIKVITLLIKVAISLIQVTRSLIKVTTSLITVTISCISLIKVTIYH